MTHSKCSRSVSYSSCCCCYCFYKRIPLRVLEHGLLGGSVGHELEEEKLGDGAPIRKLLAGTRDSDRGERWWAQQVAWTGRGKRTVTWSPLVGMTGEWRPLGKEGKSGFVGPRCNSFVPPLPNSAMQTACCQGFTGTMHGTCKGVWHVCEILKKVETTRLCVWYGQGGLGPLGICKAQTKELGDLTVTVMKSEESQKMGMSLEEEGEMRVPCDREAALCSFLSLCVCDWLSVHTGLQGSLKTCVHVFHGFVCNA